MAWTLYPDGSVKRDTDGVSFIPDPDSTLQPQQDYRAFVAGGGKPTPLPAQTAAPALTFLGFLALFTASEQAAIVNSTDARIKLFCLMAAGASYIDLTDPKVVGGTKLLESLGLIASGRAVQVLAGQAPPTS